MEQGVEKAAAEYKLQRNLMGFSSQIAHAGPITATTLFTEVLRDLSKSQIKPLSVPFVVTAASL